MLNWRINITLMTKKKIFIAVGVTRKVVIDSLKKSSWKKRLK